MSAIKGWMPTEIEVPVWPGRAEWSKVDKANRRRVAGFVRGGLALHPAVVPCEEALEWCLTAVESGGIIRSSYNLLQLADFAEKVQHLDWSGGGSEVSKRNREDAAAAWAKVAP